ncbi:hypothetical protein ACFYU8_01505 [Brevibacillus sp. NPDC003359]|uniref:hypothetical protein n=1 Tax=unclassified Brevibacillus TaxID=2684853 RepID=UPI0036C74104
MSDKKRCSLCKSKPCCCPIKNEYNNQNKVTNTFKPTINIISPASQLFSAFRAVNQTTTQRVGPADLTTIEYPDELFDLNNEYNPSTSAFTPKQDGVYLVIASLGFLSDVPTNYSVRIFIGINGTISLPFTSVISHSLNKNTSPRMIFPNEKCCIL